MEGIMDNRLLQQMEFIKEVDKLKKIGRQTYLSDSSRKENDAEHSWHLALMAMLLSEHADEKADILKVISMVLIHDIVEIDAGDTYAYDTEGNQTKRKREEQAADRIFNLLPKDQAVYMRELWEEFEQGSTAEAKFAHALDRIQPIMLNDASDGRAWKEHRVYLSQIIERNQAIEKGAGSLWEHALEQYIKPNVEKGNIKQ